MACFHDTKFKLWHWLILSLRKLLQTFAPNAFVEGRNLKDVQTFKNLDQMKYDVNLILLRNTGITKLDCEINVFIQSLLSLNLRKILVIKFNLVFNKIFKDLNWLLQTFFLSRESQFLNSTKKWKLRRKPDEI